MDTRGMVNWEEIRAHNGSRAGGFQELCVEIAMAENPAGARFFTPGDPDGGVECYTVFPGGEEWGWQAKYFRSMDEVQFRQIDRSVETALEKHPWLVRYIICVPVNLSDPRIGNEYAKDRWDRHHDKWRQWAQDRQMEVEFELWGDSQLVYLLTQEKHAARRFYWFNDRVFDHGWFRARLGEAIETADDRYTPDLHIPLGVAEQLDCFARTDSSFQKMKSLSSGIRRRLGPLQNRGRHDGLEIKCPGLEEVIGAVEGVLDELRELVPGPVGELPLKGIVDRIAAAGPLLDAARDAAKLLADEYEKQREEDGRRSRYSANPHEQLMWAFKGLQYELSDVRTQMEGAERYFNSRVLVLTGDAGVGKTHLMCDLTQRRVEAGVPALLLMGLQFTDTTGPWAQLLPQVGMPPEAVDEFVGALEEAGRVSGSRALLLIDALNEGRGREIWPNRLNAFLARLAESEWIGVVLSVRTTYLEIVNQGRLRDEAVFLDHRGFEGKEYEAARTYFEHHGIEFQSAPILTPEYMNPLYLKTMCRGLQQSGETRMPRGAGGITAAFDLHTKAVNARLAGRLDYDGGADLVRAALEAVATRFWETGDHWLERESAAEVVDGFLPGREYSRSLFRGLADEGILSVNLIRESDGSTKEVVYPSYERFGDIVVADHVISDYLSRRDSQGFLGQLRWRLDKWAGKFRRVLRLYHRETSVHVAGVHFLNREEGVLPLGVLEALCIRVPERTGQELVRLAPELMTEPGMDQAFEASIVWRGLDAFTDETRAVWNEGLDVEWFGSDPLGTLLTVSAVPGHPFNAEFLDGTLRRQGMVDRDASWTIRIHHSWGSEGPVDRMVDWAGQITPELEVDDEVVDLSAVTLAWFLTSSNRFLRDRATKALVSLLDGRLESLERMVDRFADVDDPYVAERVYAVAYGVSMRSRYAEGVGSVARSVYGHVFTGEHHPAHLLLRDYARGVIERAVFLGADLEIALDDVRPPYRSSWPAIPDEEDIQALIRRMEEGRQDGGFAGQGWSAIRSSVMALDFARYVIGTDSHSGSSDWLSIGIDEDRWRPARERREELVAELSAEERAALDAYESSAPDVMVAVRLAKATGEGLDLSPVLRQREDAYSKFLSVLSDERRVAWQMLDEKRPGFDLRKIQRFVLDRVVELGWTEERFGPFDGLMYGASDYSRSEHKAERIGKKYQWIAYHEMLAYIADHFQFCQEYGAGGPYDGPWQIGLRDIDPSAPVELPSIREKDSPRPAGAWWSPASFNSWDAGGSIENWVADASDVPALDSGLVVQDPGEPGALWICCYGFQLFREQLPGEQASLGTHRREFWLRRMAFLVPEGASDRFIEWVMSEEFQDSHWPISVPQLDTYGVFLGEHCWSPASAEQVAEQEAEPLEWRFPADADPVRALIPVVTHSGSGNGYDCSVGPESIELCLPSRAVVEGCGISWSGQMADFVDDGSRLVAYDPSARELGPGAMLIRSDVLEGYLSAHRLELCWVVAGEKMTIGTIGQPYGWLKLRAAYAYRSGEPVGREYSEFKPPVPWAGDG